MSNAEDEPKRGRGRPTLYTEEIAAEICRRVADGETLNQVCRSENMPSRPTIVGWVLEDRAGFSDRYARSKDLQIEYWADEVIDISDDGTNDWMRRACADEENGPYVLNGEHVQRSRLRIDTRKWLLSKLKPQTYGERTMLAGHDGGELRQPAIYVTTSAKADPA